MIETHLQHQIRILAEAKDRAKRASDYAAKMGTTPAKPVNNATPKETPVINTNAQRQRKWREKHVELNRQRVKDSRKHRRKAQDV